MASLKLPSHTSIREIFDSLQTSEKVQEYIDRQYANKDNIPDIEYIRKATEKSRNQRIAEESIKNTIIEKTLSEEELQSLEDKRMMDYIKHCINTEAASGKYDFYIEIGSKSPGCIEPIENVRKRNAINKARDILRAQGYQTSWQYNQIDYGDYEQPILDNFSVSWEPTIRWNEFRP